jgi:hypothetical protein
MKIAKNENRGHSADVRMTLSINGHVLPIGQLGPNFIVLREPIEHPPVDASIQLIIDGDESTWSVHLPNGIQVAEPKTTTVRIELATPWQSHHDTNMGP